MSNGDILLDSGTNEMEMLTVVVGDQQFGVNVAKVVSIEQYDTDLVTGLPVNQPGLEGMFFHRGKTIPLLNLSDILDIEIRSQVDREIVIVTEFNNSKNSFRVQGVTRIYRLSWNDFVPLDGVVGNSPCFTGSINIEGSQILVLDLEHILGRIFPDQIIQSIDQTNISNNEKYDRKNIDILFAEDSKTMRKAVVSALNKSGFTNIIEFSNGKSALEYIERDYSGQNTQANRTPVLISDIEMPKMDGLTLCREIKRNPKLNNTYVIMFSSLINEQMVSKCKSVKADNYVNKPDTNRLISILDKQCGKQGFLTS